MSIRHATYMDIPVVLALLSQMYDENGANFPQPNWSKVTHTVLHAIEQGVVILAEDDEKEILGSIGGVPGPEWFADQPYLGDLWYYVREDKRDSRAAVELLKGFKKIAHEKGFKTKVAHVFGEDDKESKDRFYERMGYMPVGTVYIERPSDG